MEAGEGSEPCRPGRLDRGTQPVDDRDGRVERDARGAVGMPAGLRRVAGVPSLQRVESTTAVGPLCEPLGVELRPALRAAGQEADDGTADAHRVVEHLEAEEIGERPGFRRRLVSPELELRDAKLVLLVEQSVDPVARGMTSRR